jgi:RNA polymerase sigma-70 factor (ECF subfamily)
MASGAAHPADAFEPDDDTRIAREVRLVEQVRTGDADALAELYVRYRPALIALAEGYLDDPDDAADVVQNLFTAIWRDRATWIVEHSVAAYLYVAVRRRATRLADTQRLRRTFARRRYDTVVFNSGEVRLTGPELERAIERIVNGLPDRCRLIYRMHRDGRCSYKDIAAALDISPHTVRLQLIKAWDMLAARLTAAGWINVLRRQR